MDMTIEPFASGHVERAAALTAASRRRRKSGCALLPSGLEDAGAAWRIAERAGPGFAATRGDGSMAGFLFVEADPDPVWGDALVVPLDRCVVDPEAEPETLALLYAAACEDMAPGLTERYAYCSAFDAPTLDAWFRLGFGLEQAYAAAPLTAVAAYVSGRARDESLTIRRARSGDEDLLASLSPTIALAQAKAPVWAGAPAAYLQDLREGFRELATEAEGIVLLAFKGSRAVGYQAWFPVAVHPYDGANDAAIELSVAATLPEERGSGIAGALTVAGAGEAMRAGYTACLCDWRTANPLSSRFWRSRGFKPYQYRLTRRLKAPA